MGRFSIEGHFSRARRVLGDISVSRKLVGGFALLLTIMLLFSGFTVWAILNVRSEVRIVAEERLPESQQLANLTDLTSDVALNIRAYSLSGNTEHLEEARQSLAELNEALADASKFAGASHELAAMQSSVDQISNAVEDYAQILDKIVRLKADRTAATAAWVGHLSKARTHVDQLVSDHQRLMQAGSPASVRNHLERIAALREIETDLAALNDLTQAGLLDSDSTRLGQAAGSFALLNTKIDGVFTTAAAASEREKLSSLRDSVTNLRQSAVQLTELQEQMDSVDVTRNAIRTDVLELTRTASESSIRQSTDASRENYNLLGTTAAITVIAILIALAIGILAAYLLSRDILSGLGSITTVASSIAGGNLNNTIAVEGTDEIGLLAGTVDAMQTSLRTAREEADARDWLKSGLSKLEEILRGDLSEQEIADRVVSEVCEYTGAKVGAFYIAQSASGQVLLSLLGTFAYTRRKNLSNQFTVGEGLIGQAALERRQILVSNVPDDYIKVVSGLGEGIPRNICVTPLIHNGELKGVLEIATLEPLTEVQQGYLSQAMPSVAVTIESAHARERIAEALEESQRLTIELQAQQAELQAQQAELQAANEELQTQQEELQSANEELEEQSRLLQDSEVRLKAQQEELQVTNEELEEQNKALDRQRRDVERAREEIAQKADELALASKYKSEFLANMSHELRTPLNSLLLLAQRLSQNKDGNLTDDQVESAKVIHGSGNDLLALINEILDLSKIEAGRMELNLDEVHPEELATSIRQAFTHMAQEKGLALEVRVEETAPASIVTDFKRLEQVLRNLVSNALKFTEAGEIEVVFGPCPPDAVLRMSGLDPHAAWTIAVRDTGIGIPESQQRIIFEAFQQADGSTSRMYGGTGLGLSISREIVRILGGEIKVASEPGVGSTFTVFLPMGRVNEPAVALPSDAAPDVAAQLPRPAVPSVPDDRDKIQPGDKIMLIVEDDPSFATALLAQCRERSFRCLVCATGEDAVQLSEQYIPQGIILDLKLPGMDGWQVLERIKADSATRHIPIHIVSGQELTGEAIRRGAIGQLRKPVTQQDIDSVLSQIEDVSSSRARRVLVVEDDPVVRRDIVELLADETVEVKEAASTAAAIEALREGHYDCMILDLMLNDASQSPLLAQLAELPDITVPPIVIYTSRDLTSEEEQDLLLHSEAIVVKGVRSQERLLDEVSLFLHQVVSAMPERKRQVILDLHDSDAVFRSKSVLIVDDDMRTVFALSKLLTDHGLQTYKAENGEKALAQLNEHPDVDLVLTDIMMPVLDGYETIRRIRAQQRFSRLPIIALTAKAMKGDQERCLAAGANDYMPKPVDPDRLLSMMRVWLHR